MSELHFLVTDGESFCHEEKRDLRHAVEMPERGALLYRQTNSVDFVIQTCDPLMR